nr:MAG TPA: hypothetical protein [Caudoviricetes sp.]
MVLWSACFPVATAIIITSFKVNIQKYIIFKIVLEQFL